MSVHDLGTASLVAFATTTFLMNITPGPAVMQAVGHSLKGANPKSVLYFCTLLPVFAGHAEGAPLRIAVLGLVATAMEYPVLLAYSLLASRASAWFKGTLRPRVLDGVSGCALLAAAGSVATSTLWNR